MGSLKDLGPYSSEDLKIIDRLNEAGASDEELAEEIKKERMKRKKELGDIDIFEVLKPTKKEMQTIEEHRSYGDTDEVIIELIRRNRRNRRLDNVSIIGGGPAGLMTAIEVLRSDYENPALMFHDKFIKDTTVYIYEKRLTATRDQILLLHKNTIEFLPDEVSKTLIKTYGCYVRPPPNDQMGRCYSTPTWGLNLSVPIRLLEKRLMQYLKKKYGDQVIIKNEEVNEKNIIDIFNSSVRVFVCDGANSFVRKYLNIKTNNELISWGLTYTFIPKKRARIREDISKLKKAGFEIGKSSNFDQHRYRFFRTNPKLKNSKYYFAIQLKEKEYNKIKKKKGTYNDLPKSLKQIIDQGLIFYGATPKNKIKGIFNKFPINITYIEDSNNYSFELNSEKMKELGRDDLIGKVEQPLFITFIGDSLMSSNFFSGLNLNNAVVQLQLNFPLHGPFERLFTDVGYLEQVNKLIDNMAKNLRYRTHPEEMYDEFGTRRINVQLNNNKKDFNQCMKDMKTSEKNVDYGYYFDERISDEEKCNLLLNSEYLSFHKS
jgi:hypothetical protein